MKKNKIPFDIKYKDVIEDKKYSVVTRDDRQVKIISWDGGRADCPIVAIINGLAYNYTTNGSGGIMDTVNCYNDLFIIENDFEPKFKVGDTLVRQGYAPHTIRSIWENHTYICVNDEGDESHILVSEQDEWELLPKPELTKAEREYANFRYGSQAVELFNAIQLIQVKKEWEWVLAIAKKYLGNNWQYSSNSEELPEYDGELNVLEDYVEHTCFHFKSLYNNGTPEGKIRWMIANSTLHILDMVSKGSLQGIKRYLLASLPKILPEGTPKTEMEDYATTMATSICGIVNNFKKDE